MEERTQAYLLPGLRSPFSKIDRELAALDALRLSIPIIQQTVAGELGPGRKNAGQVDLVLWGSVIPTLAISNWAREVWLDSGLDQTVPAQTVIQQCATSLAAATQAAAQVGDGRIELALCGGVESMTHTQIGLSNGLSRTIRRAATARGPGRTIRTLGQLRLADLRIAIPGIKERTTGLTMGQHTERMAHEWGVTREEQDRFALASHQRASAAEGEFFRPLLARPGSYPVDGDTVPRPTTSLDRLAALRPAFDRERGTITAGNSSPLTDGAACCWVAAEAGLKRLPDELPRVRIVDWEQAAIDLRRDGLLMAPAVAIPRMLRRHDLAYTDIDLWEIHEAFAAQVLCTTKALENEQWLADRAGVSPGLGPFPSERVNPNGGSVALGHPFAATGARILSQTVRELADRAPGTRAVVSVCAAGGLGHVALLEAV